MGGEFDISHCACAVQIVRTCIGAVESFVCVSVLGAQAFTPNGKVANGNRRR